MPKFTEIPYHILKDFFLDTHVDVPEVIEYFTIETMSTTKGSISPSGVFSVREGDNITFIFVPNSGYYASDIIIDSSISMGALDTYTFSNVSQNHTIYAEFDKLVALAATISHTPQSVMSYGEEEVTLIWSTSGAEICSIDQGIGSVELSGSTVVTPLSATVYTLTASDSESTVTVSTSVGSISVRYIDRYLICESEPVSGTYCIPAPTFSGMSEYTIEFNLPELLTIGGDSPANKYYTFDESTPTSASSLYTSPLTILAEHFTGTGMQTLIVKAVCFANGDYSEVSTSMTYKKVSSSAVIPGTDPQEVIVIEEPLTTTAMPVTGAYIPIVLDGESYDETLTTTAMPVTGAYIITILDGESYDDTLTTTAMPVTGAYWKSIVEG